MTECVAETSSRSEFLWRSRSRWRFLLCERLNAFTQRQNKNNVSWNLRSFFSQFNDIFYGSLFQVSIVGKKSLMDWVFFSNQSFESRFAAKKVDKINHCALCTIFTILLTFLGKSCNSQMRHASDVYYSYMVSAPIFEFRNVIRNFWHQDTSF